MASREMTRFRLKLVETDARTFQIYLVEQDAGGQEKIVADATLTARIPAMPPLRTTTQHDHDVVMDAAETAGQRVLGLDDAIDHTSLPNFAAFRDQDARGSVADSAYTYLLTKVVPTIDQGSIEVEDDAFVVMGEGQAMNPDANRAGNGGSGGSKGKPRPKSRKKLKHGWF